jgi:cytoskeletal protein RodZ
MVRTILLINLILRKHFTTNANKNKNKMNDSSSDEEDEMSFSDVSTFPVRSTTSHGYQIEDLMMIEEDALNMYHRIPPLDDEDDYTSTTGDDDDEVNDEDAEHDVTSSSMSVHSTTSKTTTSTTSIGCSSFSQSINYSKLGIYYYSYYHDHLLIIYCRCFNIGLFVYEGGN